MSGLIPFNRKSSNIARMGFDDFYAALDDFYYDGWTPAHSLLRDTFKIDVKDEETEYIVEAELPGVNRDEIDLSFESDLLSITVHQEGTPNNDEKGYIYKERRFETMSRSIWLNGAKPDTIKATLSDGVLTITVPKEEKLNKILKINID